MPDGTKAQQKDCLPHLYHDEEGSKYSKVMGTAKVQVGKTPETSLEVLLSRLGRNWDSHPW